MPTSLFRDAFISLDVVSRGNRRLMTGRVRGVIASAFAAAFACCHLPCEAMSMDVQRDSDPAQITLGADCSLVTDLWRSQFLMSTDVNQDSGDLIGGRGSSASRTMSADTSAFGSEEIASGMQGDLPIPTETDAMETVGFSSETLTMTDWETAESHAVGAHGKTFTKDGPSAVTGIVAVVGLIVVSGAYFRGRK